MIDVAELQWLSIDDLTTPLRRMTGARHLDVTSWAMTRLVGGGGEGIGVWRITGQALLDDMPGTWSLVVKGCTIPADDADPGAFNWPQREMELYRSGVIADLPGGIRAPTCYGSLRRDDGSIWVWLEDITGDTVGPQTMDDYAAVSRRLGQFNGAYLNGVPLPRHRALATDWVRKWVEATEPSLALLAREADHPLVRQVYVPDVVETYLRLWERRHDLLDWLDRMPRTFCHEDAFQRNIFMRKRDGAVDDVILIDWSFTGVGAVGEEMSAMVMASVVFQETPLETIEELQDTVLDAYIAGLRDAGWDGNPRDVRNSYLVATLLRYGVGAIRVFLAILLGTWPHADVEQIVGRPFHELVAHMAAVHAWIAKSARERPDLL